MSLPRAVRSGVTSYKVWAPPKRERNVITSSSTSSAPSASVHSRIAFTKGASAGLSPTRCGMRSSSTHASSPLCLSRIARTPLGIVEGNHDDVGQRGGRSPKGRGHTGGGVDMAPVPGCGGLAHLDVVVLSMIGPLDLGDLGPTRKRARSLHRTHHRFGAGIHEPELLEAGVPAEKMFGVSYFDLGGQRECGAFLQTAR